MMRTNLWLDDVRRPPGKGWTIARTCCGAIWVLQNYEVIEASLDYDLIPPDKGSDVVLWMICTGTWPRRKPTIHSANPAGARRMAFLIDRYGPYR